MASDDAWLFQGPLVTRKLLKTVTIELWVQQFGETEIGVWCDDCVLPSAVRTIVSIGRNDYEMSRLQLTHCFDCGRHSKTVLPVPGVFPNK